MESVWNKEVRIPERKSLTEDIRADVAVIGAGMAGILTAYALKCQGKKVVVLEADRIGSGQTGKTTAKITSQHGLKYAKLCRLYGTEKASLYARANQVAIDAYEWLVKEKKISCHFKRVPSFLYATEHTKALRQEEKAARLLKLPVSYREDIGLPFHTAGGLCLENQAQFSPLLFLKEIAKELVVYEHTKVLSVKGHRLMTEKGSVRAKHIVFATHYPIANLPGFYFLRQHQERSYCIALAPDENAGGQGSKKHLQEQKKEEKQIEGLYYGIEKNGISIRRDGEKILLGGFSHRTGWTPKASGYHKLTEAAKKWFPGYKEIACWSAQDCMPHDGLPFIGRYSVFRPYWYVATGFGKWGMTASMLSAIIICDDICGRKNPYASLFAPFRFHPVAGFLPFLKDVCVSTWGLLSGYFGAAPKCPHMGCQLKWNPVDESWDCPCHGSRLNSKGELLDDPSVKNAAKHFFL